MKVTIEASEHFFADECSRCKYLNNFLKAYFVDFNITKLRFPYTGGGRVEEVIISVENGEPKSCAEMTFGEALCYVEKADEIFKDAWINGASVQELEKIVKKKEELEDIFIDIGQQISKMVIKMVIFKTIKEMK